MLKVRGPRGLANLCGVKSQCFEIKKPQVAITQPHVEIILRQPEAREALHEQRDQFDLRLGSGFAEDVGVELVERSLPAFLRAFVAEKLRDAEPLDGTLERVGFGSDEAANRRRLRR